ncbi:unnamed protein product (macronuclear) [Paramecium tetraurelia]|uniref:Uncharacterized protein n=1 Tax=Paramecium tetraurelia TaxID=5888 RepID=A0C1H9_PARTE|nr:uncharacterized protein GSPATT00034122001 [Paramecium tetraurelia]CAK64646.1 unnamed protein product [Paramecium tetraurelia]|eukprot:XP_001432043.1 hypothetical protein (macronuclear) [Paramecium tetraurelia strain d4-2]
MNDYMDYIKGIKTYIDDSANKIQDRVAEIVRIDDIKDLNKMQTKKYRHRNNNKQPSLVTSGEVSQAEIELQKLQQQNHQLYDKMKELEEQRTNLKFQLGKYRQLIADKRKLLNKECRDGFQLLTQTRRPRIMSEKKSKSPQLFLTSTSTMSQKKLTQVHILLRDVMKVERQPPIIRSNRRYTFDQFMQLNKTEYFSYIHNHLPKIKEYFLEFSFKRTKQFKTL